MASPLPYLDQWLTSADMQRDYQIGKSQLHKLIKKGKLVPFIPSGRKLYFKRAEVESFFNNGRAGTPTNN